jgi:hypothetical protein
MTEVGEGFVRIVSVSGGSFTTVFAPSGEKQKITMVYFKDVGFGNADNQELFVSPANGSENSTSRGTNTGDGQTPPVGASTTDSAVNALQPIIISDTDGLYIGNTGSNTNDAVINGVRIA